MDEKFEIKRTEKGEVDPAYWRRAVIEAFKGDPLRIIIELIKNSADSYTRLYKRKEVDPPFEIFVTVFCETKKPPVIEVLDHAEGMDSNKLKEALKYGTRTSMGEDLEAATSAEKGVGLKDALMALEDNLLTTVRNGLINQRTVTRSFDIGIVKEDEKITQEERRKLNIPNNGTSIKGTLPEYFSDRKFSTICERLQNHFLLRKLLQNPNYKIYVINGWNKNEKIPLSYYSYPDIDKKVIDETFEIPYKDNKYKIHLTLNKSKKELQQRKPYGEAGLLFYYGTYSVLDFTFGKFDGDPSFSRYFGEVRMEVEKIIKDPEEAGLVDEKRRGLNLDHPFIKKLFEEIEKRLKKITEENEASDYSFDKITLTDALKEINKMYKDIKGSGEPPTPPLEPQTFAFYPKFISLPEYEPRIVTLIINSSIIKDTLKIKIESNNPKIKIKGNEIIQLKKEEITEDFIAKHIQLYSEQVGATGEITATSEELNETDKIGVEVLKNPLFYPENGFAFVPDKTTIKDGGEKEFYLCINKDLIKKNKEVNLSSEGPIICPNKLALPVKWVFPGVTSFEKNIVKNVLVKEVQIKVDGTGHVGEKAKVVAAFGDKQAGLLMTVVPEPSLGGVIKNILLSSKDTKKICGFVEEEGIIEVYYKHPLIQKYMRKKGWQNKPDFLVFVADTIAREIIRAIVSTKIREGSLRIFNMENPEPEIEDYIIQEYYERGPRLHELLIPVVRTLNKEVK